MKERVKMSMKIKRIQINGFGRWSQKTFDFVSDFQAIVGQNESGKSTLRAFMVSMLFGFPTKKGQTNVYTPKDGSSYGGSMVVDFFGQSFEIKRVGRVKSVLTIKSLADDQFVETPEKWLEEQLAPLDRQMFDAIFNFSQQDLAQISQLAVPDLKQLLLNIGAPGSNYWLKIAQQIDKEASRQYTQRKTGQRALNILAKQYNQQQVILNEKSKDVVLYVNRQQAITDQQATVTTLRNAMSALDSELQQQQELIQSFSLFEAAQAIKSHSVISKRIISETDMSEFNRLQALDNIAIQKIAQLKEQITDNKPSEQKITFMADDVNKRLKRAQVVMQRMTLLLNSRNDLVKQQRALERQIGGQNLPSLITVSEQKMINYPKQQILFLGILTVITAVIAYFLIKPALILPLLIGLYTGYKYWVSQHAIGVVRHRYANLPIETIQGMQGAIKSYPQTKQQILEIDKGISKQLQQAIVDLEPAIEQLQLSVSIKTIDDLEFALIDIQQAFNHAQLTRSNSTTLRVQQQQQLLREIAVYEKQHEEHVHDLYALYDKYDVANADNFKLLYHDQQSQTRQQQRYSDMMNQLPVEQQTQFTKIKNSSELTIKQRTLDSKKATLQSDIVVAETKLSDLKAEQRKLINEDQFATLQQDFMNEQTALIAQFGGYLAEKLTGKWITQALTLASKNRLPKMQAIAVNLFSKLTNERYTNITFSGDDIVVMTADHQAFNIVELSTGTQEQLYVALRLALSQVIADVVSVPILIDDGFVNFDQQRRDNMIIILKSLSTNQQVFYFTTERYHHDQLNVLDL